MQSRYQYYPIPGASTTSRDGFSHVPPILATNDRQSSNSFITRSTFLTNSSSTYDDVLSPGNPGHHMELPAEKSQSHDDGQYLEQLNRPVPRPIRPLPLSGRVIEPQNSLPPKIRFRPRDFYPSPHHQAQFDELERTSPNGSLPGDGGNLCDLQDGIPGINEGRPPHPHRTVLMCAIYGSPERKLTLKELKMALRIRFPSYAKEDQNAGWVNSIRHVLSRDPAFSRIERPGKDYTKGGDQGSWWTLTFVGPPDVTPISRGLDQIKPTGKRQVDSLPEPQAIFESSPRMERQTPDRAALQYTRSWNNLNSYPPTPSLYLASPRTAPIFSSHPNTSFPLPSLQTTGLLEVEKWVPRNAIPPPRSRKSIDDELLRALTRPQETIWRKEYSPSDSE
ncbi:hypothetical protein M422DRAFT_777655 [Sphaerobolus stellatus SS14]|nr:hypothetical protein M422DRAFT_777655 [Sphaerobolus stellatus SS14]